MQIESLHTGEHVLSEANGKRSRDTIILNRVVGFIDVGTVLATLDSPGADGAWVAYDPAGADDGRRSAKGVLYAAKNTNGENTTALAHTRECELIREQLTGLDPAAEEELKTLGIILR
ncbi:MAG: head decoration protein [Pseudomonadota bacterium]